MRKRISFLLTLLLVLGNLTPTFACTATIIGKNVSADGNPIIARTEDWSSSYNKTFIVVPAKTYAPGDMYEDAYGFTWPMPKQTYKYIAVPDGYQEDGDIFEAAGWNEYGVAMTATVTAECNEAALEADPLTDDGIYESSMVTVVLPRIKTAKEGVELLGTIMDEKGCQEGAVVIIADQKEIWYMELLTGHQYCAVKYPDDCYSVFPNCFMLGRVDISDKNNVYASKDLVNLPKTHGFLVEENGLINIKKTYAEPLADGNRDRLWGGINFLDSSKKISHDAKEFDLFQKTSKKISLEDVMELQRYRYEGTPYDANLPENKGKVRAIGVIEQSECHIIQIKNDYPKELGGVLWVAMGNAEHAMYVPIIGGTAKSIEPYYLTGNQYTPDSAYWTMRGVSALSGLDRELYGKYVREYYKKEEARLIKELKEKEKEFIKAGSKKAIELATSYTVEKLQKAYDDATLIYKELNTHFFDLACDQVYKEDYEIRTPYVPSLLGEERLAEIYKELSIPLESGPAQPLEKPGETSGKTAALSTQKVTLNGTASALQGYFIDGSNYYKLRDLAAILAVTGSKFNVTYDAGKGIIEILPGKAYEKSGSDLSALSAAVKSVKAGSQGITAKGEALSIEGYNIDGYNYYKLRDIVIHIDCSVDYNEKDNTVILLTK